MKSEGLTQSSDALKASVRIHLFTLLCEEMKIACARKLEDRDLVAKLIGLLASGQRVLAARAKGQSKEEQQSASESKTPPVLPLLSGTDAATPKWMAPLLLLLDLYEKMSLGTRRRVAMEKVTSHIWKWFDIVSGKWCAYTAANNKIIDDAFWAGQNSIRVTAGRRRYLLQFSSMIQVNEETGNRRPMMLSLKGLLQNTNRLCPILHLLMLYFLSFRKIKRHCRRCCEIDGRKCCNGCGRYGQGR